jgi:polyribonucleotide nucleotidyltransferase
MPGKQGLLHISEVSWKRLDTLDGVLKEGDKVKIQLTGTDPKTGKLRLSRKVLMPKPDGYVEPAPRERREGGDDRPRREGGGDRRNGGGNDRPRGDRPQREPRNDNNSNPPQNSGDDKDMML